MSLLAPCPRHHLPEPSTGTKQLTDSTCLGSAQAENDCEHGMDALVGYGKKMEKESKHVKIRNLRLRLLNNSPNSQSWWCRQAPTV